jgi:hypothetical protein
MEIFSTVPEVADRTILLLRKTETAGSSMASETGLFVTSAIVTGVITDASVSETVLFRLHAAVNKISNNNKQQKGAVIFVDIIGIF